jgi:high frequency lysogenization protein
LQNKYDNIAIALAGLVQSVNLVKELAQTGKINEEIFHASIQSIFATHPEDTALVFGGLTHVQSGLEQLAQLFSSKSGNNQLTIRHILAVMRLQRKLSNSTKTMETLSQRIEQAKKQADYFSMTHSNVLANLGDIYLHLINTFQFRFYIQGNQRFLSVRENVDKIRALLLAAIRAAVLWRQNGGSRLQLIFSSKKIKASIEKVLAQIKAQQRNHYVIS